MKRIGQVAFMTAVLESVVVKDYLGKEVTLTADPDSVKSGEVIETFKINVASGEEGSKTVHYASQNEPFAWNKLPGFAEVLKALGAELSDDQIAFLGEALKGDKTEKAIDTLVAQHNANTRANAKQNQYTRVTNHYMPMDEESEAKARKKMIENFAAIYKVSFQVAESMLNAAASQVQK